MLAVCSFPLHGARCRACVVLNISLVPPPIPHNSTALYDALHPSRQVPRQPASRRRQRPPIALAACECEPRLVLSKILGGRELSAVLWAPYFGGIGQVACVENQSICKEIILAVLASILQVFAFDLAFSWFGDYSLAILYLYLFQTSGS